MTAVIITHVGLAIALFFIINLVGQYTPSALGYYQLTTFLDTEEAPAFNFVIRVLTPVVFLILISTFFYSFSLDRFAKDVYFINVYYVIFRGLFNILINRFKLINWPKFVFHSLCIVGLSYFIYIKFIIIKKNLLPDFSNMANELWIIIIIFLYNFINNLRPSDKNAQKRKDRYVATQFNSINRKYSPIIKKETNNQRLRQIALAIIIYEAFNRPKLFRLIEYVNHFIFRKPHTLGIMQVTTTKFIGDKESVKLGVKKLLFDYEELQKKFVLDKDQPGLEEYKEDVYQRKLIEMFNPDLTYSYEVLQLADEINTKYFNNAPKFLFSKQ